MRDLRTRLDRLEHDAEQRRDMVAGIPPMHEMLQALHTSSVSREFLDLADKRLMNPLNEAEQQRLYDVFRIAIVERFGRETLDLMERQ